MIRVRSAILLRCTYCQSRQNFTDTIKDFHRKKKKEHDDTFQNWAEFQERGYKKPEYMRSWIINEYGPPEKVLHKELLNTPQNKMVTGLDARRTYLYQAVRQPSDVLIKVHAASLNPIDIRMCEGYGLELFNFQRNMVFSMIKYVPTGKQVVKDYEFPLVLGRDFSGTVVDVGSAVYDLEPGDEVYGAPSLQQNGTLSDLVCVNLENVTQKPQTLSHIQAASIPYVGLTVVSSLKEALAIRDKNNRALVLGGSGGIGTFAIQYLQSHGFSVTTTCSTAGMKICSKLGAECINYHTDDIDQVMAEQDEFGIILDAVGAVSPEWAKQFMIPGGWYVTLRNPLVEQTKRYGIIAGLGASATQLLKRKMDNYRINIVWGFYKPNRNALLEIARMVDSGNLKPIVDTKNIYNYDDVPDAFNSLGQGHTKGKIVINVSGLPEAVYKPPLDKIIHL